MGMIIASNHDDRILTFFTSVEGPEYKPFKLIIFDLLESSKNYTSLYTQKQFKILMRQNKISNMANMVDSVFNFTSKALDKMFSLPLIKKEDKEKFDRIKHHLNILRQHKDLELGRSATLPGP